MGILAVTAVPAHFRPPWQKPIYLGFQPQDIVQNILLYLPFGLCFRKGSLLRVTVFAAVMSTIIEIVQMFSVYRYPGPMDVVSNTTGAIAGFLLARRLGLKVPGVAVGIRTGMALLGWTIVWLFVSPSIWINASLDWPFRAIAEIGTIAATGFFFALSALLIVQSVETNWRLLVTAVGGLFCAVLTAQMLPDSKAAVMGPAALAGSFVANAMLSAENSPGAQAK